MHMRHMHIDIIIIMLFTVSFFMNAFCPFSRLTGLSPVDGAILVLIIDFVKSQLSVLTIYTKPMHPIAAILCALLENRAQSC